MKIQTEAAALSPAKRLIFGAITFILVLLVIEMCMRVYFAFNVGPSVLLYGTPFQRMQVEPEETLSWKDLKETMPREERLERTVGWHENDLGGYTKYFPHQKRVDIDIETKERFEVGINSKGFRGREFTNDKEPGVIRVLTLGASSTFGFFDRDDETYPVYLEKNLNSLAEDNNSRYEVINFGIPHLTAANIYRLFIAEGVALDPDVVTFYEGNNDAAGIKSLFPRSFEIRLRHAINKAGVVSVAFGLIDSIIDSNFEARYSPEKLKNNAASIADDFVGNIARINAECEQRGITFIVANQQKNSELYGRRKLKELTFQQEIDRIWEKLLRPEEMSSSEIEFLTHSILMQRLEAWIRENRVPFIDMIAQLDHDRDVMVSTVHLNARGNQIVASAFAEKIINVTGAYRPVAGASQ